MVMSNVVQILKELPNLKRTKYNSIAKVRKWDDNIWYGSSFLPNSECTRYIPELQEQPTH